VKVKEVFVPLKNGNTAYVGFGKIYKGGGYVRVVDIDEKEIGCWSWQEWIDDPQPLMKVLI